MKGMYKICHYFGTIAIDRLMSWENYNVIRCVMLIIAVKAVMNIFIMRDSEIVVYLTCFGVKY